LRSSVGGYRLCGNGELAWCFGHHRSGMRVETSTHEEFNVHREALRFGLN
jgi:hypothetical protein